MQNIGLSKYICIFNANWAPTFLPTEHRYNLPTSVLSCIEVDTKTNIESNASSDARSD